MVYVCCCKSCCSLKVKSLALVLVLKVKSLALALNINASAFLLKIVLGLDLGSQVLINTTLTIFSRPVPTVCVDVIPSEPQRCQGAICLCTTQAMSVFGMFRPDIHVQRRICCSVASENGNSWQSTLLPQRQRLSSLLSVNLASFFFWVFWRPYSEFTLTLVSLEASDDFRQLRKIVRLNGKKSKVVHRDLGCMCTDLILS